MTLLPYGIRRLWHVGPWLRGSGGAVPGYKHIGRSLAVEGKYQSYSDLAAFSTQG